MFVIFGWNKETKPVDATLSCYCYRCQRKREWQCWKATEWIMLYMMKTIPFLSHHFVACSICNEQIKLDWLHARKYGKAGQEEVVASFVEVRQLVNKTEVQKRFLQSKRNEMENSNKSNFS
jgi:hypothetical protein